MAIQRGSPRPHESRILSHFIAPNPATDAFDIHNCLRPLWGWISELHISDTVNGLIVGIKLKAKSWSCFWNAFYRRVVTWHGKF